MIHILSFCYQRVQLQLPCVNITGCKLPQTVQFTLNYVHAGVGLCELVLPAAGFLKGMTPCLTGISSAMKFKRDCFNVLSIRLLSGWAACICRLEAWLYIHSSTMLFFVHFGLKKKSKTLKTVNANEWRGEKLNWSENWDSTWQYREPKTRLISVDEATVYLGLNCYWVFSLSLLVLVCGTVE